MEKKREVVTAGGEVREGGRPEGLTSGHYLYVAYVLHAFGQRQRRQFGMAS